MSQFLAPLNYGRAFDVLRKLDAYTTYTPPGALAVQGVLRESYPLVFTKTEQTVFAREALLLEMPGAAITDPLVFVSHLDGPPPGHAPGKQTKNSGLRRCFFKLIFPSPGRPKDSL